MADSVFGSKKYKELNDYPIYSGKEPIDWGLMQKASNLNEQNSLQGNFGHFKRLNNAATHLRGSWAKMSMRHVFSVCNRDTICGMNYLQQNHQGFKKAAPIIEMLSHLEGIFMGKFVYPKYSPKNVKIFNMEHPIFEEQKRHLQYFIDGLHNEDKPGRWIAKSTVSHMIQIVKTAKAIAHDYFEENKKLGYEGLYFNLFALSNRQLESKNGLIRTLKCDKASLYGLGKAISRFMDKVKYKNRVNKYTNGADMRFQQTVNFLSIK
eukprot:175646_1